ncbi:tail completion protein gp17 [Rhizorhabdus histidinilytica]|uniref:tail completion protein gp17 n=1 Tax=Rhizorhabdus histidinilytica TaxID=439228 RepID=UPI0032208B3D
MTGALIVTAVLRAASAVTAIVPEARIKAGRLPEDIQLPALVVRNISSVERRTLTREATIRTTDRVSVAVRAASYRDQGAIIRLVRSACAGLTGDIGGGSSVAIINAGTGPDVAGPGNSFEQSQDFLVSFDAAA